LKLPTTLKIGGNRYKLRVVPENQIDGDSGETDTKKLTMRLADDHAESAILPSLLHEILHAINIELSEKEVEFLAQALYQVLKENPRLTKLFLK